MSTLHTSMFSTGPGAVGPGTEYVKHRINPSRSRGRITAYLDGGVTSPAQLVALESQMPAVFPGSTLPLSTTRSRLMDPDAALIVAYYGSTSTGSGGFRRVSDASATGYRDRTVYDYPGNEDNRDPATGLPKPIVLRVPLVAVRWNSSAYTDIRPTTRNYLTGTYNANNYAIDGYAYAAGTLQFQGEDRVHEKYGGIDRWILYREALWDRLGWTHEKLSDDSTAQSWTVETYTPIPNYLYAVWPNMP